ncbi:MAG: PAS domain S-box protein [Bacteroidia bacterium]
MPGQTHYINRLIPASSLESLNRRSIFLLDTWSAVITDVAIFLILVLTGYGSVTVYVFLGIPLILHPLSIWFFHHKNRAVSVILFISTSVFLVVSAAIVLPAIRYESMMMLPIGLSSFLYLENKKIANRFFLTLCAIGITMLAIELFVESPPIVEGPFIIYNQIVILMIFIVIFTKLFNLTALYTNLLKDSENNAKNLVKSESRYRDLFENVNEGIVQIDKERRIIASNKAARELLEISGEYPVHVLDLIHPDENENASKYFKILKTEGRFSDFQSKFSFPSGKTKYLEVSSLGIFDENRKLIGSRDIIRDITAERESEIARTQTEEKYRSLFENNLYGIALLDQETRFLDFNKAFMDMMGYDQEELKAQSVVSLTEASHVNYSIRNFEKLVRKEVLSFTQEKEYVRKNGDHFHAIAAVKGIYDASGNFISAIATVQDITERIWQEKIIRKQVTNLNEKNLELEKYITSNLELENFAYIASHDLQAPIRSIISFTQLLHRTMGDKLNEEEKEYMGFILSASNNMYNLIRDLLTLSRVNTTKIRLEKLNLQKIISDIKLELKPVIDEKNATIHIGQCPLDIRGDRTKIYQLFQNLLTNAMKFQTKGKRPEIEVSCETRPDDWLFCIKDNGIGIPEEYQEKIFLLFRRLHNNHHFEGTGIGLALCKKIVAQHNGRIWVTSTPGDGSQFYFTIAKDIEADLNT